MKIICIFVLLLSIAIYLSNKLKLKTESNHCNDSNDNCHSNQHCSESNQCCTKFKHCLFYQVLADNFTDYGCSQCFPNYLLVADANQAGVCQGSNPISNCLAAQTVNGSSPECFECKRNYALSSDASSCIYVGNNDRTENCVDYQILADGSTACYECEPNYTLTNSYQCVQGCSIDNCRTCGYQGSELQCLFCDPGFIGTIDLTTNFYTSCLTCKQWIKSLNVQIASPSC